MISLFYATGIVSLIYLGMGLSVLSKGKHDLLHQLFFLLCMSFTVWCCGASLFYVADTAETALWIFRITSGGFFFFPPLFVLFFLILSGYVKTPRSPYVVPIFLPGICLYAVALIRPDLILAVKPGRVTWLLSYNEESFWYYLNIANYVCGSIAGIVILFIRMRHARGTRERLQARTILFSLVPAVTASLISGTILPSFGVTAVPIVPLLSVFWLIGVRYAMQKYRLLELTPELIADYLISRSRDMVLIVDPHLKIIRANRQFIVVSGYSEKTLIGRPIRDFFSGSDFSVQPKEKETRKEATLHASNGEHIPVQLLLSPVYDEYEECVGILISVQDLRLIQQLIQEIHNRDQAEKERQSSEEKFQKIFLSSPVGIFISNFTEGEFIDVNDAGVRIVGFPKDEIIGKTVRDFDIQVTAEDYDRLLQSLKDGKSMRNMEVDICRKDRRIITCLISAERIDILGTPHVIFSLIDITAMKTIEEELHKAQKLESIGVLAGGIAHDFNNILTSIMGNIALAKMSVDDRQQLPTLLQAAEDACVRAKELTNQLLTFSKVGFPMRTATDIREVIKKSVEAITSGTGTNVAYDFSTDMPESLFIDAPKMSQVFQNLAANAVQAMKGKGRITVRGETLTEGAEQFVHIVFSDTGIGIPIENISKIFDPFYTTKGTGTGLGLSIVLSIITKHRGKITVSSVVGKGTDFHILLPRS